MNDPGPNVADDGGAGTPIDVTRAFKPVMTFAELLREDARSSLLRLEHELRTEHEREGCPLDQGWAACRFHGIAPLRAPGAGSPDAE